MSNDFLYKTITNEIINNMEINFTRDFFYYSNDKKLIFRENKDNCANHFNNKNISLIDDSNEWDYHSQTLLLDVTMDFKVPKEIFTNDKIVYYNTILGVGLTWRSNGSRLIKHIKLGEFIVFDEKVSLKKSNIEIGPINGNVSFNLVLYISLPGTLDDMYFCANDEGIILYNDNIWNIIVEGDGSIFPIIEEENENAPLYQIRCDFNDMYEDSFSNENVAIILNKSHPLYGYLYPKANTINDLIGSEVFSTALTFLITKIKKQNGEDKIDFTKQGCFDSIFNTLRYFNDVLGIDINKSDEELLLSVKKFFLKE